MFRSLSAQVVVADDSNLNQIEVQRSISIYQTKDNKSFNTTYRVGTSDAQHQISFSTVLTTGYFLYLASDYPIQVAVNASSPSFTLNSNSAAAVNAGAPLPDQCCFIMSGQITSLYLTPISSATQTANVKITIVGDPTSAYV